jgi:signal transduction histidine kinase
LKFTPSGGKVTVTASHIEDSIVYKDGSVSEIQKLLRIEVKDTGAGVSEVSHYIMY